RQYAHAKRGNIRNVYTPCFVTNGKEWRGFFDRSSLPTTSTRAAVLKATLQGDRLQAEFLKPKQRLDLHVVILACDLATDVRRGENRGKILKEQFVAIHHGTHPGDSNQWHLRLPSYEVRDGSRYALALFVTEKGALEPLQATGGWLRH
ncbi:MAG: DUF1223 domain-containing protein, partial [Verrucomicrobiae bacterium]|nr:DUF1223 domain-containing protein [Verrucomicrobiae bacterium]